jgi:hypothetical protein
MSHPVVLVGDLNSRPDDTAGVYGTFTAAGYADSWTVVHGPNGGFTSGQSELLDNVPSLLDHRIDLRPVAGGQLDHRAGDVSAGGGRADHQPLGDLVVGQPPANQPDDLPFPVSEQLERFRGRSFGAGVEANAATSRRAACGASSRVTGRGDPDAAQQLGRLSVLEQKPSRPRTDGLEHQRVLVVPTCCSNTGG